MLSVPFQNQIQTKPMIAVTNTNDFTRILCRLEKEGKKPRWYGIGKALFICNETQLKQAKQRYEKKS